MAKIYGLDTSTYPGDNKMAWYRTNCDFRYTGFYIAPAPRHPNASWMSKRPHLAGDGWGFLPVYVGLQINNSGLGQAVGKQHGQDAVAKMNQAGFATHTICYLDLEDGTEPSGNYAKYISAWVDAVNAGNYTAGIYCSHRIANWCRTKTAFLWTFRLPPGTNGQTYPPNNIPPGNVTSGAVATQYRQNVFIQGNSTQIDINVSGVADPSNPAVVGHALNIS